MGSAGRSSGGNEGGRRRRNATGTQPAAVVERTMIALPHPSNGIPDRLRTRPTGASVARPKAGISEARPIQLMSISCAQPLPAAASAPIAASTSTSIVATGGARGGVLGVMGPAGGGPFTSTTPGPSGTPGTSLFSNAASHTTAVRSGTTIPPLGSRGSRRIGNVRTREPNSTGRDRS